MFLFAEILQPQRHNKRLVIADKMWREGSAANLCGLPPCQIC